MTCAIFLGRSRRRVLVIDSGKRVAGVALRLLQWTKI